MQTNMKTQQEIVVKAKAYAESIGNEDGTSAYDYVMGYNQCQEDMIKLLEFEINKAFIHGQENAQKMEAGLERNEVKDYANSRIRILNKQDKFIPGVGKETLDKLFDAHEDDDFIDNDLN